MRPLLTALLISVLAPPALSFAQTAPPDDLPADMTQIIRGILGELPGPADIGFPPPPSSAAGLMSFPVRVTLQGPQGSQDQQAQAANMAEWLVIAAYAPKANNPQRRGELLGETRILLRGLTAPYDMRVDIPAAAAQEMTYITGRIEDKNGNIIRTPLGGKLAQTRGSAPAQLVMAPAERPDPAATPASTPIRAESLQGRVNLSEPEDIFRGASLTVQLFEAGLAGGQGVLIRGEKQISIDGQRPPYPFDLTFGVPENGFDMPLQLQAFITDWAGRKTHVMAQGIDYNGPGFDYRLTLDAFRQGLEVTQFNAAQAPAAKSEVRGQAVFRAPRGLPSGAYLRLELINPLGATESQSSLASQIVPVNAGLDRVDFALLAPSVNFDPELPKPILNITLESPAGIPLFERKNIPAQENIPQIIQLFTLPNY